LRDRIFSRASTTAEIIIDTTAGTSRWGSLFNRQPSHQVTIIKPSPNDDERAVVHRPSVLQIRMQDALCQTIEFISVEFY
jgi:hypothetical protein